MSDRALQDRLAFTEQQAAALEETAAALDQITATVQRTAAGAKQASDAVAGARSRRLVGILTGRLLNAVAIP